MAKRPAISAKATARRLRSVSRGTFIQRSREESSEQKAIFHHVTGAGRSRVKREFFGVDAEGQEEIGAALKARMDQQFGPQ